MNGRFPLLSVLGFSVLCALVVGSCAKGGTGAGTCSTDTCGSVCTDLLSDAKNCGTCGHACGTGQLCNGGTCSGCAGNLQMCGTVCTDVMSDVAHCGGCQAAACPAGNFCSGGHCSATCAFSTCPTNRCVDLQTSPLDCGTCGAACTGGLACVAGHCACPASTPLCLTTNTCLATSACPTGGMGGRIGSLGGTTGSQGGMTGSLGGVSGAQGGMTGSLGGAGGSARACVPNTTAPAGLASIDVLSDFEEGNPTGAILINQGAPKRTGWWYVYADPTVGTQTPAASPGAVAVTASGDTAACNKWSMHSTATNHPLYTGFGAGFLPMPAPSQVKSPYDLSAFDGISFKIKSGGAAQPAVFFEVLTRETQPDTSGGTIPVPPPPATPTLAHTVTDLFNTRGQMINVSGTWTTVYVPFATLIPRWVPAAGGAKACAAVAAAGDPKCQAPQFNPASALGLQFSMYNDPGFPKTGTLGTYDLWVDDVMLYKRAATGAPVDLPAAPSSGGSKAFPRNASVGTNCHKPVGPSVDGKFLVSAYNQWKTTFVVPGNPGFRVQRPEVGNDTVSEGIAYGMLISVYMDDKALFDGLWQYWKANADSGTPDGPLMKWLASSSGTATDADEDAAFAMLMASRQWTGAPAGDTVTYANNAQNLMHAVLAHDMATTSPFILAGSNYKTTAGLFGTTNPSYFSPAWYRAFAAADTTAANAGANGAWMTLANNAYAMLAAISPSSPTYGLYGAWCGTNCTVAVMNGGSQNSATDTIYQYDSHRIPLRIGLDYCWNGGAAASGYLAKNAAFFATRVGANGIGRILDQYNRDGSDPSIVVSAPNSASIIGTAAVGAMSTTNATFVNDAYQAVFDMVTRGSLAPVTAGQTPYSYYNATVGFITLLAMTGNLTQF